MLATSHPSTLAGTPEPQPAAGSALTGRPRTDGSHVRAMAYSGCCQSFCLIGGWDAPGDAALLGLGHTRDQYDQRRPASGRGGRVGVVKAIPRVVVPDPQS